MGCLHRRRRGSRRARAAHRRTARSRAAEVRLRRRLHVAFLCIVRLLHVDRTADDVFPLSSGFAMGRRGARATARAHRQDVSPCRTSTRITGIRSSRAGMPKKGGSIPRSARPATCCAKNSWASFDVTQYFRPVYPRLLRFCGCTSRCRASHARAVASGVAGTSSAHAGDRR